MKRILCIALLIVGMVGGLAALSMGGDTVKPLIIDVRTEAEWNNGHIEAALLIPYEQIGKRIGAVAKDKTQRIYVYCSTGRRSAIAKKTIDKMGYRDVVDLGSLENAARILQVKIVR
jgi:phage shock protein E